MVYISVQDKESYVCVWLQKLDSYAWEKLINVLTLS